MGYTLGQKLIKSHLVSGDMKTGSEVGIRIDQTLTQDATGTMAYLEFEAMGVERVRTELSVAYIDHNTLQTGFENADDHRFIQSCAKKRGVRFHVRATESAIRCTLKGSESRQNANRLDSHTPTGGGIGMLAIGAGGLDVAVAMGGGTYYIIMPKMVLINLKGKLSPWVSAKDIILKVLQIMTVKGGVGKIIEYGARVLRLYPFPKGRQSPTWAQSLEPQPPYSRPTILQEHF
jgi:aconitate hydratase